MLVRLYKFWDDLDLFRQSPKRSGVWRGVRFIDDRESGECDCAVIHGKSVGLRWVKCPADRVWLMMGEPPNEHHRHWHFAPRWVSHIYTTDDTIVSPRHRPLSPMLPWHVQRDYDFLAACPPPEKTRDLSWVTSSLDNSEGHRKRMAYLQRVRGLEALDLFGRGFQPIDDKWDALAPYRYSIAFESYSNALYFSEKVMDCFLAWTMPIYHGCTALERYFPPESFVRLDPDSPHPIEDLVEIIRSDRREKNLDAIAHARDLVLNKYNFLEQIVANLEAHPTRHPVRRTWIRDHTASTGDLAGDLYRRAKDRLGKRFRLSK